MKLIYIIGSGRSGSTLLDITIGSQPRCFSSGEICNLVQAYASEDLCACGSKIASCSFWSHVISDWMAKNSLVDGDLQKYAELERLYGHSRSLRAWWTGISPYRSKKYSWYLRLLGSLLLVVQRRSGAYLITDSSKSPVRLLHLTKAI